ncbi:hypothetical protein [Stieleria sp.]|uniref:hypothetical protein n=1 Tax=Stieleria sp. TaxID=2795976 RepID=UPI00356B57B6
MSIRYVFKTSCVVLATLCIFFSAVQLAAAPPPGKGGGNGGGGSSPPVQYGVTEIPFPPGPWLSLFSGSMAVVDGQLQVVGIVRDSTDGSGNRQAFLSINGSTILLNDLVDGMGGLRGGWSIANARDINQFGQIAGWAEKDGEISGFRFDPLASSPENLFVVLPKPEEGVDTWPHRINNDGDVVFAGGDLTVVNSGTTGLNTVVTDVGVRRGLTDRDANGCVKVLTWGPAPTDGSIYVVHQDSGAVSTPESLPGIVPFDINAFGVVCGYTTTGKQEWEVAARYTTQLEKLKDGKKEIFGEATSINSLGDVGIDFGAIYTDQHGYLKVEDLIHPDHVATYTQDFITKSLTKIGEPDGTSGFFPILVAGSSGFGSGYRMLLLTPLEP